VQQFSDDPGLQVARLTVDLLRPVPNAPLQAHASTVRRGGRIHVVEAALLSDGELVTKATALLLRRLDEELAIEPPAASLPPPEGLPASNLSGWVQTPGGPPPPPALRRTGLHTTIEVRWLNRGDTADRNRAWVRLPLPLVEGEENTPLVLAATVSDFTNAFTNMGGRAPTGFINADISLYLHRYPAGDWIGLETQRAAQPYGLAVSTVVLHDERGPIGAVVEAVIANQRR
jgi:hypothetical protein